MENRRPSKKRKNDSLINYLMIALIIILIFALIVYVAASLLGWGKDSNKPETKSEIIVETQKENRELNTVNESSKEVSKENPIESKQESKKESVIDNRRDTVSETVVETPREAGSQQQVETPKETRNETPNISQDVNLSGNEQRAGNRTPENPYAAIASDEQIRNASEEELVEMIIRGDLGFGLERLQILESNGLDPNYYLELVNQRLSQ